LPQSWTRAAVAGSRQLTAWDMGQA
jgi:hypothetical protein